MAEPQINSSAHVLMVADRRRRVARLVLQGISRPEIAIRLGMSLSSVNRDCGLMMKMWRKEAAEESYQDHVNVQRKKLQVVQTEAWNAFHRSMNSKGKIKEIRSRMRKAGGAGGELDAEGKARPEDMTVLVRSGPGDPRFLAIVTKAIEEENALLKIRQPSIPASEIDQNVPPISIEVSPDDLTQPMIGCDVPMEQEDMPDGTVIEVTAAEDAEPTSATNTEDSEAAGGE